MTTLSLFGRALPYFVVFSLALLATLVLTPLVREMNRRLGLVDKPDPRRINKVPIPRGGGLALFLGTCVTYLVFLLVSGHGGSFASDIAHVTELKLGILAAALVALGYADDKWSLPPKAKLLGQLVVAGLVWAWCDLGFVRLFPDLPAWADCVLTVFWITGAINAFNLIDGLDGLASGIALIATVGMAGSLFIVGAPSESLFYFAFAGGLLGFLAYNYNPASVFLGDCGSMFIGYVLSTLPLLSQHTNSFLVSVGVPILAMGVPIFDTSLAIVRRCIRHLLLKRESGDVKTGEVMTADSDHLHHRILRAVGLNQRKAAGVLYAVTAIFVAFGLVASTLKSETEGLWLIAVAFGSLVIFRNMARIELYDAGRFLNTLAHDRRTSFRRRCARLKIPILLALDITLLIAAYFLMIWIEHAPGSLKDFRLAAMIRVFTTFLFLCFFRAYSTVWSRAALSNYFRIFTACFFGGLFGGAIVYYLPFRTIPHTDIRFTIAYMMLSFTFLIGLRLTRPILRDLFYALDCGRLKGRKDVSRILVYGAGLRYRVFRREIIRTTSANERIIVGLLDDDILMRGQYIGGLRVEGTLQEAAEVIARLNVDTVVIACVVTPEWMKVVRETLKPTGVKLTYFSYSETEL